MEGIIPRIKQGKLFEMPFGLCQREFYQIDGRAEDFRHCNHMVRESLCNATGKACDKNNVMTRSRALQMVNSALAILLATEVTHVKNLKAAASGLNSNKQNEQDEVVDAKWNYID